MWILTEPPPCLIKQQSQSIDYRSRHDIIREWLFLVLISLRSTDGSMNIQWFISQTNTVAVCALGRHSELQLLRVQKSFQTKRGINLLFSAFNFEWNEKESEQYTWFNFRTAHYPVSLFTPPAGGQESFRPDWSNNPDSIQNYRCPKYSQSFF